MSDPTPARDRSVKNDFGRLPDLASRTVGGSVIFANDELFAERENLIKATAPTYSTYTFGHKGQVYDGWETRRRREPGHDWALIRLGAPGIIRGIVVDTAYFKGNYPPEISVEACGFEGYPTPAELEGAQWEVVVPKSPVTGDAINEFVVDRPERFTHVRLNMYPDGGIARLRVHGDAVSDPRLDPFGAINLAALTHGAAVTSCSNMFFSHPSNLISPGQAQLMGEGWETSRRRDDGNDWVEVALVGPGVITLAELDTTHFLGNSPGWASLQGRNRHGDQPQEWTELMPRTRLQPDTPHRFRLNSNVEVTDVRLDIYPDGGMARLRLPGMLSSQARDDLALRWFNALAAGQAAAILRDLEILDPEAVQSLVAGRPLSSLADLPTALQSQLRK